MRLLRETMADKNSAGHTSYCPHLVHFVCIREVLRGQSAILLLCQ